MQKGSDASNFFDEEVDENVSVFMEMMLLSGKHAISNTTTYNVC